MAVFSQTKGNNIKIVAGEAALDSSNPTPVVSGLRTIYSVALTLKLAVTPGDSTQVLTYDVVGGRKSVV